MKMLKCARCKNDPIFELIIDYPRASIFERKYLCKKHLIAEGVPKKMLVFAGIIRNE